MAQLIVICIKGFYRLGLVHTISAWPEFGTAEIDDPHLNETDLDSAVLIVDAQSVNSAVQLMQSKINVQSFKLCMFFEDDVYAAVPWATSPYGYIHHKITPDRLRLALNVISAGDCFIDERFRHLVSFQANVSTVTVVRVLSDRETEVLKLIALGASNCDIASTLGLSLSTIKATLRRIFSKLDLDDRTQAAIVADRNGWLS